MPFAYDVMDQNKVVGNEKRKNYASFRIPILKHFIKHKPIISEECNQSYNIFSKDQGLMILVTFSKFF